MLRILVSGIYITTGNSIPIQLASLAHIENQCSQALIWQIDYKEEIFRHTRILKINANKLLSVDYN
jgi:hypothetical protein